MLGLPTVTSRLGWFRVTIRADKGSVGQWVKWVIKYVTG